MYFFFSGPLPVPEFGYDFLVYSISPPVSGGRCPPRSFLDLRTTRFLFFLPLPFSCFPLESQLLRASFSECKRRRLTFELFVMVDPFLVFCARKPQSFFYPSSPVTGRGLDVFFPLVFFTPDEAGVNISPSVFIRQQSTLFPVLSELFHLSREAVGRRGIFRPFSVFSLEKFS